jgi:hypothetical protein
MAKDIGINRCWFHGGRYPHYDIPKKMMSVMSNFAKLVSNREVLVIIKGTQ